MNANNIANIKLNFQRMPIMRSTYSNKIINGFQCSIPNVVSHETSEHYISYNNYDTSIYGSDTTAIVTDSAFLILNGDHRDELNGLSKEAAIAYFHSKPELRNKRSDISETSFREYLQTKAIKQ